MEIKDILDRATNLGKPIIKDAILRLLMNKLTWILILILLLPAILGLWAYTNEQDERQVQEIGGDKIYYYDTENEWLFTEDDFEYTDKTNKIIANRLDSNRDFTDLVTGNLTGSINISE